MVDEDAPVAEGGHLVDDRLHLLRREVTERQRDTTIGAEPHHVLDDRQEPAVIVEHVHAGLARFLPGERRHRLVVAPRLLKPLPAPPETEHAPPPGPPPHPQPPDTALDGP